MWRWQCPVHAAQGDDHGREGTARRCGETRNGREVALKLLKIAGDSDSPVAQLGGLRLSASHEQNTIKSL